MARGRPPLVGTEHPLLHFVRRLIEGAILYFIALPFLALFQIIGEPLSLGTGLPLPWIGMLLPLLVVAGALLRAHYWR